MHESTVPPQLFRMDRWVSATISADPAPGKSLGDGLNRLKKLAADSLPESFHTALVGSSRDFAESSGSILYIFILSLVIVYLILAAQFESFREPFVILITVPLALAGALSSLWLFGQTLNIFSEIGLVMLIGLVTKNGILIVEFANQRLETGLTPAQAVFEAAQARLRPILMTTLCMVMGTLPIALALGAGAESRKPMGTAIIGGLLVSLSLTLLVVPAMYVLVSRGPRSEGKS
jgi:multidrug efflux pump